MIAKISIPQISNYINTTQLYYTYYTTHPRNTVELVCVRIWLCFAIYSKPMEGYVPTSVVYNWNGNKVFSRHQDVVCLYFNSGIEAGQ